MSEDALTRLAPYAGCAGKVSPERLEDLVTADLRALGDAAWFTVGDVQFAGSIDVSTPVADDPDDWGAISAAHALSDLYASGARPVFGLALLGWSDNHPSDAAKRALCAARAVFEEVGAHLGGGHSLRTAEPLLGFAVIGDKPSGGEMSIAGFRPGDLLCLSKPIGSGIIVSAPVFGIDVDTDTKATAVRSMRIVNRDAAAVACASGARGCTDVSGYGLLGACAEVAAQSGVTVEVAASRVPLLPGVTELVTSQAVPARADETWCWISRRGLLLDKVGGAATVMLCGPETSGGLLVGLEASHAEEAARRRGFAIIGRILDGSPAVHVV